MIALFNEIFHMIEIHIELLIFFIGLFFFSLQAECIVLRERKLNIAPAIKKQPFSRSFDGSTGSPPSVPTSTYYYANGTLHIIVHVLYTRRDD